MAEVAPLGLGYFIWTVGLGVWGDQGRSALLGGPVSGRQHGCHHPDCCSGCLGDSGPASRPECAGTSLSLPSFPTCLPAA